MKKWISVLAMVLLAPAALHAADPEMARVVTFKENVTTCLASVAIKTIDGKNRQLPNFGFDIEPGWHTMHGVAKINLNRCPVNEERIRKSVNVPPLEWLFERGKIYYVGLDHSSPMRENWRLVVWKVEDMDEAGEDGDTSGD